MKFLSHIKFFALGIMFIIPLYFFVPHQTHAMFDAINEDIALDTGASNGAAFADFDGDDDIDIYVANGGSQQNKLWLNNDDGTSFTAHHIPGDLGSSQRPSVGDVDGDGDIDIYVPNDLLQNQQNKLWINDGAANFTADDITGDLGSSWDSAMFDADGDGDLDIYVAQHHNQQNRLWINDGLGNFTADNIVGDMGASGHTIVFDADGDGDNDIYVSRTLGQSTIWINDGLGNFTSDPIPGDTMFTYGGAAGDVDADGDLDLYLTTWSGAQNKLYINDGLGNFTSDDIPGDMNTSRDAFMTDLDSDGDLDIYTFVFGSQNLIWENDGTGNFTAATPITGDLFNTFSGFFVDLSVDGFVDLYSANNGQNKLWLLNVLPTITITAPTKVNNAAITNTTISVVDEMGILAAGVVVNPATTATTSLFSCLQISPVQVNCTLSIDTSGNVVITATDQEGGDVTVSELNYVIDTTAPNISVFVDTITIDVNNPIFTFSAADDIEVDYFEVTYVSDNAGPGIGILTTDTPVTSPLTLALDPDESLHTVTFTVYDTAGNSTSKTIIFPPIVNFITPTLVSNTTISDASIEILTPTGNDIDTIILDPGTTGAILGTCTGDGGDLTSPYAQPVTCSINTISATGTITVTGRDSVNLAVGQNDQSFTIDTVLPIVTITAPTKIAGGSITDTTIRVTDNHSILASDIAVDIGLSAPISSLSCVQTTAVQVDCTVSVESSGNLVITVTDEAGNSETESENDYIIDIIDPLITITAPTKLDYSNGPITDTTIRVRDNYGVLVADVSLDPGSMATSLFVCIQTTAFQVDCTISINESGDLIILVRDELGNSGEDTEVDYLIVNDISLPVVTITAPTKSSSTDIIDTTILVTDDYGIAAADISVDTSTVDFSDFICIQTSATQVDCTITISSSGNLVVTALDLASKTLIVSENSYIISSSSSPTGFVRFICGDPKAVNYDDSDFGRHKDSLCRYESTLENPFGGEQCQANLIVSDNMKQGDQNGQYSSYNKGIVNQVHILQQHMNRLLLDEYGNQASGPVDGIFGNLTKRGVERLQLRLNQLLPSMVPLVIDGVVGPFTRAAINNSCTHTL
jgi:hypothetical protein